MVLVGVGSGWCQVVCPVSRLGARIALRQPLRKGLRTALRGGLCRALCLGIRPKVRPALCRRVMGGLGLPKFGGVYWCCWEKWAQECLPVAGSNREGRRGDILWVSGRGLWVLVGVGCCGGLCCCAVSAGAAGASSDGVDVETEVRGGLGPGMPLIVMESEDRLPLVCFLGEPLITRQSDKTTYLSFRDSG